MNRAMYKLQILLWGDSNDGRTHSETVTLMYVDNIHRALDEVTKLGFASRYPSDQMVADDKALLLYQADNKRQRENLLAEFARRKQTRINRFDGYHLVIESPYTEGARA